MSDGLVRRSESFGPLGRGVRDSIPVAIALLPFGTLFGALAVANGLLPGEAVLMSATILAGASQMVGIELFGHKVQPALIVFSLFVVNFRHVLYSAVLGRRIAHWPKARKAAAFVLLCDPVFAEAERTAERGLPIEVGWYFGMGVALWLFWVLQTAVGATSGRLIVNPHALGLDFLLPIYFLGLVMGFRASAMWGPVVLVSAVVSVCTYRSVGSPWHVPLARRVDTPRQSGKGPRALPEPCETCVPTSTSKSPSPTSMPRPTSCVRSISTARRRASARS